MVLGANANWDKENDCMNECVFIYRTYHIMVSWGFIVLIIEWDCQLVKAPLVATISSYYDLTHPPNYVWNVGWNLRQTTRPGTTCPTLYDKCLGSLTSSANHVTLKMQETGPTVYSPYPRWLQSLTVCWCNYKGNTFCSVILRPWVLVWLEWNSQPPVRHSPMLN